MSGKLVFFEREAREHKKSVRERAKQKREKEVEVLNSFFMYVFNFLILWHEYLKSVNISKAKTKINKILEIKLV